MNTLQDFYARLMLNGGSTVNLKSDTFPTKGFAVSLKGHERKVNAETMVYEDILSYVNYEADMLYRPGVCLGGWIDQGTLYLDLSMVVDCYLVAEKIARQNNQLAIYNLETNETIYMEKE
jgi:hypothetical protein